MTQAPYVPMKSPEPQVTQGRMQEILARRTQGHQPALFDDPLPSLCWRPPVWTSSLGKEGSGYLRSLCESYSVSRDRCDKLLLYTAWYRLTQPPDNLGCFATLAAAQRVCETHRLTKT